MWKYFDETLVNLLGNLKWITDAAPLQVAKFDGTLKVHLLGYSNKQNTIEYPFSSSKSFILRNCNGKVRQIVRKSQYLT